MLVLSSLLRLGPASDMLSSGVSFIRFFNLYLIPPMRARRAARLPLQYLIKLVLFRKGNKLLRLRSSLV